MKILGAKLEAKGKIIPFSPDDEKVLHTTNIKVDNDKKKVISSRLKWRDCIYIFL